MASSTQRWPGRAVLASAHCAGIVDLVALPAWVGALIAQYGFDPLHAGALATVFLAGAVLSSLLFGSRLHRLPLRLTASAGFGLAALAFGLASQAHDFAALAGLHALAGAGAACGLGLAHGAIAASANPHRLFAIVFLGATPNLIAAFGGAALFVVFAGVMTTAALARDADSLERMVVKIPSVVWSPQS
jgi:MFS family permease